jgi:hypothetical protein
MVSAFTGIPVRKDVAMTGEITLRGRVLPIGGLKSKILAAHLSGAKMIILPRKNEKDLRDIPEEIRKQIKLVLVDNMEQVLDAALRRKPVPLKSWTRRRRRAAARSRRRNPSPKLESAGTSRPRSISRRRWRGPKNRHSAGWTWPVEYQQQQATWLAGGTPANR